MKHRSIVIFGQDRFQYKLVEGGKGIAMNDKGFPVIVDTQKDNEEIPLDAIHLYGKVPDLTNQLKQAKENHTALQTKYKGFDGIEDPAKFLDEANKAIETLKNIDEKKLVDAGKVEELKRQAQEALQAQMEIIKKDLQGKIDERDGKINDLTGRINNMMIGDKFNNSKFAKEKIVQPITLVRKYFGDRFKVETEESSGEMRVVAQYPDGNKVYSKVRIGELADFEEALQLLVEIDPEKDSFLAGAGGAGTGADKNRGPGNKSEIEQMKEQYQKARKDGNTQLAISLKNRLAEKGVFV